jgi:hypothetical protein
VIPIIKHTHIHNEAVIFFHEELSPVYIYTISTTTTLIFLLFRNQNKIFLIRSTSTWGVSSIVAGPFGNKEFGRIMYIFDQLMALIFEENLPQLGHRKLQRSVFNNSFRFEDGIKDSISLGASFDNWNLDVADKWSLHTKVLRSKEKNPLSRPSLSIQNLLHACNLQEALSQAVLIDPNVATKDGTSTTDEMQESSRRITMVIRAALSLTSAFVYKNTRNQAILFNQIEQIKKFAIPSKTEARRNSIPVTFKRGSIFKVPTHIVEGVEGVDDEDEDEIPKLSAIEMDDVEERIVESRWLHELAQEAILAILFQNSLLCSKLDKSIPAVFYSVANMGGDLSVASALDIIFVVVKPGVNNMCGYLWIYNF